MKKVKFPLHGWMAVALLLASETLMLQRVEPFASYFYSFAWWSYILLVDGIVYWRRGNSLLMNRRWEFWVMVPWSVAFWLVLEAFNLRLENWYYSSMEPFWPARWAGYFVAYATVLPALFETLELLESFNLFSGAKGPHHSFSSRAHLTMIIMGGAMLIASLIFPRYCFPLAWLGFAFLLDPVVYRFGGRSLLKKLKEEGPVKIYRLLIAGFICGFLWEFWNFWATIKWHYTVPFFDEIKIFEMHVMGFFGFAPFAVECYVMYAFVCLFRNGRWWEAEAIHPPRRVPGKHLRRILATAVGMAVFFPLMFRALDTYTVDSYASRMGDFAALPPEACRRLESLCVDRADDFDRWAGQLGVRAVSEVLGIPEEKALQMQKLARLSSIKGMGTRNVRLLELAGIDSPAKLARQDPDVLYQALLRVNNQTKVRKQPPRPAILKNWILSARFHPG